MNDDNNTGAGSPRPNTPSPVPSTTGDVDSMIGGPPSRTVSPEPAQRPLPNLALPQSDPKVLDAYEKFDERGATPRREEGPPTPVTIQDVMPSPAQSPGESSNYLLASSSADVGGPSTPRLSPTIQVGDPEDKLEDEDKSGSGGSPGGSGTPALGNSPCGSTGDGKSGSVGGTTKGEGE